MPRGKYPVVLAKRKELLEGGRLSLSIDVANSGE
jgi:hypothetical protein